MYAIVDINGIQTKVTPDAVLEVALFDGPAWRNNERRVLFQGRAYDDSDSEVNDVASHKEVLETLEHEPWGPFG